MTLEDATEKAICDIRLAMDGALKEFHASTGESISSFSVEVTDYTAEIGSLGARFSMRPVDLIIS